VKAKSEAPKAHEHQWFMVAEAGKMDRVECSCGEYITQPEAIRAGSHLTITVGHLDSLLRLVKEHREAEEAARWTEKPNGQ
jgi:hypothetical protein